MDRADLLKVLDTSEAEQYQWCIYHAGLNPPYESLPGLAFRLRDEVKLSIRILYLVMHPDTDELKLATMWWEDLDFDTEIELYNWWINKAKPIHWIIAVLIAKGE